MPSSEAVREQSVTALPTRLDPVLDHEVAAPSSDGPVRRRLEVGAADDPYEREADAAAAAVVARLAAGSSGSSGGAPPPAGDGSEGGPPFLGGAAGGSPTTTRRTARRAPVIGAAGGALDAATQQRIERSRGRGAPLPEPVRRTMEGALGADLGSVRVHAGRDAAELNDAMQARAFAVGSDVFFRDGMPDIRRTEGQSLLAHELTHVVQNSGGTRRSVHRLWDPKTFYKETEEGLLIKRGDAIKAIDKWLVEYDKVLAGRASKEKCKKQEQLLLQMQYAAQQWIEDHVIKDGGGAEVADPGRTKRLAAMRVFETQLQSELGSVRHLMMRTYNEAETPDVDITTAGKGYKKLKEKYEGDATSTFNKLAWMVDLAVPNAGDEAEIEVEFRWPVEPSGIAFVGGRLKVNAQRDSAVGASAGAQDKRNVLLRTELAVTFGGQFINVGEVKGELNVYMESSAKTAEQCTTLLSYAIYRRWRESYVLPDGAANYIWGGRTGNFGKLKAEKWSKRVETTVMDDESAYVETGMGGAASGKGGIGPVVSMGGNIGFSGGTRYDKESVEKAKGRLGADNTRSAKANLSDAQTSLGKSVYALNLGVDVSGGILSGGAKLSAKWFGTEPKGAGGTMECDAVEIALRAKVAVPNIGAEEGLTKLIRYIVPGAMAAVSLIRRSVETHKQRSEENAAAFKNDPTKKEAGHKARWAGGVLGMMQDAVPVMSEVANLGKAVEPFEAIEKIDLAQNAGIAAAAGKASLVSTAGLVLNFGVDCIGKDVQLSLNFEKDIGFEIPMFLRVNAMKSERIISFKWTKRQAPQPGQSSHEFSIG